MSITKKYFPFLVVLLALFLAECFIQPLGEFSLNDDWAYAKAVYQWHTTGKFSIGIWPAMSLWSHALIGLSFVKLFGFSLSILRLANMALCVVTLFYLFKYFCKANKPNVSAMVCAFIIFNPYYLNLFNSFMTDLSFFNFSFLAFYFFEEYLHKKKWHQLILFFVLATLAMLTRQLGIILFLAFVLIAIVNYRKVGVKVIAASIICLIGGLMVLFFFEKQQFNVSKAEWAYQGLFFSHKKMEISATTFSLLIDKTFMILKFSGALLLPLLLLNFNAIWQAIKKSNKIVLICVVALFAYYWFTITTDSAVGNLFINLGVGIESTVDMLMVKATDTHASNNYIFYGIVAFMSLGYFLFAFYLGSISLTKSNWNFASLSNQFIIVVLLLYLLFIGIAESSFDRYCVYFMLFFVVYLMSTEIVISKYGLILSMAFFVFLAMFSILATRDYFEAAHLKNKIRSDLREMDKAPLSHINAGLEYQLWDGTNSEMDWINWDHYNDKKFIISRNPVDNFEVYKTYTYRRYIPFRIDTFFVLKNKAFH